MKASEARELKLEDRVVIYCGTSEHVGVIVAIEWPKFKVSLLDYRGRQFHRYRRYQSLRAVQKSDRVPAEFLKPSELPNWLEFPVIEDYEIAADYCNDLALEQAAIVLRDPRCNPSRLTSLDSFCTHRDSPYASQLKQAAALLDEFPMAQSKLTLYASKID